MTGEKRTETRMRCYNTLCIPYISLHPSLHACIVYDCREGRGVIYREYTYRTVNPTQSLLAQT